MSFLAIGPKFLIRINNYVSYYEAGESRDSES